MTWSLTASGHAWTPEGESTSHRVEQKLLAELQAVLSKPEFGAVASLLRGKHVVSTEVHLPAAEQPAADQAAVEEPAAAAPARRPKAAAPATDGG